MDNTFGDYAFVHFNSLFYFLFNSLFYFLFNSLFFNFLFNSLFFNFLFTPHRVLCRRAVICLPLCVTSVSR